MSPDEYYTAATTADLSALLAERFGATVPAREKHAQPNPIPRPHGYTGASDDDIARAQRRRILCAALDDVPNRSYQRGARGRRAS